MIKSLIETDEGRISTIVLSNNTYLPILEEDNISSKYDRQTAESMASIDKELYTLHNNDDERKIFINMKLLRALIRSILAEKLKKDIPDNLLTEPDDTEGEEQENEASVVAGIAGATTPLGTGPTYPDKPKKKKKQKSSSKKQ